jgi:hypothetical protein
LRFGSIKKSLTAVALSAALMAGSLVAGTPSAFATNQTSCWDDNENWRYDLVEFYVGNSVRCYANTGLIQLNRWVPGFRLCAGDNRLGMLTSTEYIMLGRWGCTHRDYPMTIRSILVY